MAAVGWWGPLIDLSSACSHLTDYVQLLVFVHRSTPVQYKASAGGTAIRTDIQVGDNTLPFFSVSFWGNHSFSAGDILLFQNVKITRFASFVEAKTVQYSSILCLVHPYESLFLKGVDELVGSCRVGVTVKEKLRKVITWVQQQKSTLHDQLRGHLGKPATKNWKVQGDHISCKYQTLAQVLHLRISSHATFRASVGEMFLPHLQLEPDSERMFISRRLMNNKDKENIVEDVICTGCQQCGSPLDSESASKPKNGPFFCEKSSNHQHVVAAIYRPFMLYVWEELECMPILVKNMAAQVLFGNIRAEKVYQSYKARMDSQNLDKSSNAAADTRNSNKEAATLDSRSSDESVGNRSLEYYLIWLILLRMLLLQGKNSPLEFVVSVNPSLEIEDGRYEMVSMSMPCFQSQQE